MSENFGSKDYSDYFSALERQLNKGDNIKPDNKPISNKSHNAHSASRESKIGKCRRLRPQLLIAVIALALVISIIALSLNFCKSDNDESLAEKSTDNIVSDVTEQPQNKSLFADFTEETKDIPADIESESIIFVNCDDNTVVAARNAKARCYPASTTKIMTVLVAAENIVDINDTFTMSYEITDPLYIEEATMAGFLNGEAVNMTDLLYGAILPSGADACMGLAIKISGSEENFVELMNKKANELGLRDTHFTNSTGLFNPDHYTTAEDMAVIVRAAMQNELCREIMSSYKHTTAATPQNPEGIELTSTLFSYMYGTEPEGADILGGKTGFVSESGYCIASFGKGENGQEYVCVTLSGVSLWPTAYDQIDLYSLYAGGSEKRYVSP